MSSYGPGRSRQWQHANRAFVLRPYSFLDHAWPADDLERKSQTPPPSPSSHFYQWNLNRSTLPVESNSQSHHNRRDVKSHSKPNDGNPRQHRDIQEARQKARENALLKSYSRIKSKRPLPQAFEKRREQFKSSCFAGGRERRKELFQRLRKAQRERVLWQRREVWRQILELKKAVKERQIRQILQQQQQKKQQRREDARLKKLAEENLRKHRERQQKQQHQQQMERQRREAARQQKLEEENLRRERQMQQQQQEERQQREAVRQQRLADEILRRQRRQQQQQQQQQHREPEINARRHCAEQEQKKRESFMSKDELKRNIENWEAKYTSAVEKYWSRKEKTASTVASFCREFLNFQFDVTNISRSFRRAMMRCHPDKLKEKSKKAFCKKQAVFKMLVNLKKDLEEGM